MRVLVDTNVVLDVLLNREPWAIEAATLWRLCSEGSLCLDTFIVCPVDQQTLETAFVLPGDDFEDNLQIACAQLNRFECIVTRDVNGFTTSSVPAVTTGELLQRHDSAHH